MDRPTDPVGIDVHDIYAHYGAAMYAAQCVERQLCLLGPMLLGMGAGNASGLEIDAVWERLFAQTMGQTVKEFERTCGLPAGFEQRVSDALKTRTWLAHNYFWERAAEFITERGREKMRVELTEVHDTLHALDQELVRAGDAWRQAIGVTSELVQQELDRVKAGGRFPDV